MCNYLTKQRLKGRGWSSSSIYCACVFVCLFSRTIGAYCQTTAPCDLMSTRSSQWLSNWCMRPTTIDPHSPHARPEPHSTAPKPFGIWMCSAWLRIVQAATLDEKRKAITESDFLYDACIQCVIYGHMVCMQLWMLNLLKRQCMYRH